MESGVPPQRRGRATDPADDWISEMARRTEDPQYQLRLALEDALAREGFALATRDAAGAEVLATAIAALRRRLAEAERRAARQ